MFGRVGFYDSWMNVSLPISAREIEKEENTTQSAGHPTWGVALPDRRKEKKTLTDDMPQHIKKGYARGIGADGHSGSLRESAKDLMNGRTWCTASHKSFASTTECGRCALSRTGLYPLLRGTNGATQRRSTRKRSFAKTDATVCSNYTISIVLFLHKHFLPCLQPGICRHVLTRSPEKGRQCQKEYV